MCAADSTLDVRWNLASILSMHQNAGMDLTKVVALVFRRSCDAATTVLGRVIADNNHDPP